MGGQEGRSFGRARGVHASGYGQTRSPTILWGDGDKLLEIDDELYSSYVTEEQGEKVMYVELLKAQYGTLRAA